MPIPVSQTAGFLSISRTTSRVYRESRFLLRHAESRVRVWRKQHESMAPSCMVSMVHAGSSGGNVFLAHVGSLDSWHTLGHRAFQVSFSHTLKTQTHWDHDDCW